MAYFSDSNDPPGKDDAAFSGTDLAGAPVTDSAGNRASIVSLRQEGGEQQAWVRLEEGTQLLVPLGLLARQDDGTWRLPFSFQSSAGDTPVQMSFPVMEEELQVGKRVIDTGRGVRVRKTVAEREQTLDEPLRRDELVVERVPIGRMVAQEEVPQMRYEGDTLVVPVLEEVLVVQKQLLLKEEVRVTRHRREQRQAQSVRLRSEQVTVERFDEGEAQA